RLTEGARLHGGAGVSAHEGSAHERAGHRLDRAQRGGGAESGSDPDLPRSPEAKRQESGAAGLLHRTCQLNSEFLIAECGIIGDGSPQFGISKSAIRSSPMAIEPLAIGVCSWSLQVKNIPELSRLLKRLGSDVVQIACGDPHHAAW